MQSGIYSQIGCLTSFINLCCVLCVHTLLFICVPFVKIRHFISKPNGIEWNWLYVHILRMVECICWQNVNFLCKAINCRMERIILLNVCRFWLICCDSCCTANNYHEFFFLLLLLLLILLLFYALFEQKNDTCAPFDIIRRLACIAHLHLKRMYTYFVFCILRLFLNNQWNHLCINTIYIFVDFYDRKFHSQRLEIKIICRFILYSF